jgi:hypothetical protein
MFREVSSLGSLATQLVYYRGPDRHPEGECRASRWYDNSAHLTKAMSSITCRAGYTQLKRVLQHCCREAAQSKVNAVVFVGDACEEPIDVLTHLAADLGRLEVPVFMFQEGDNQKVEQMFREIARVTGGAYCRFDRGAAKQLSELLKAVSLFAVGGLAALEGRNDAGSVRLIAQLK